MRKWAFILLVLAASCVKEQDAGMGAQVRFQASTSPFEGDTKAAPVTSLSGSFGVLAYTHATPEGEKTLYGQAQMTEQGGIWSGNLYWPGTGHGGGQAADARYVSFHAFWPGSLFSRLDGNRLVGVTAGSEEDMLVAASGALDDNPRAQGGTLQLNFRHAFTGVRFEPEEGYTLSGIVLSGILSQGDYNIFSGEWENQRTRVSYTLDAPAEMLLLMPQTLPEDASITLMVSYRGQEPEPLSLTDLIAGTTWHPGTLVTYLIAQDEYTYHVELLPATGSVTTAGGKEVPLVEVSTTAGTAEDVFQITSYRENAEGTVANIPWHIKAVYSDSDLTENVELSDGYYGWLQDFGGAGGISSPVAITSRNAPVHHTDSNEEIIRETLRSRASAGSSEWPLNLSDRYEDGSYAAGNYIRESANCYIVNGPGWYKFPLVMGNGIKWGGYNMQAFNYYGNRPYPERTLATFLDYLDREISNPVLQNPMLAAVLWADRQDPVSSLNLYQENGLWWIKFYVSPENIDQGNVVFAAMDIVWDGDSSSLVYRIMWSWHIWITDYVPGQGDLNVNSHSGKNYTFMPLNLGWTELSSTDVALESTLYVQLETETGVELGTFAVRKAGGPVNHTYLGRAPTYQWGRKDPIIPGFGKEDYDDISGLITLLPQYLQQQGHDYVLAGWTEDGNSLLTLGESIRFPHMVRQVKAGGDWCSVYWINRWNAAQNGTMGHGFSPGEDYSVVKTIYDPSPAGYHVPPAMAFSGLTKSGDEATSLDALNLDPDDASSPEFRGYRFKTSAASDIIDFPIAGYRHYQGAFPAQFIRSGGMTYYWSAEMYNQVGGAYSLYMVDTRDVKVSPLRTTYAGLGAYVRPVKE